MRTVTLRSVIEPRNEITHPRANPTGEGTFVGLEHIEPNTGRRIGSVAIRLEQLTGRKARFFRGDIVYGYLRPYLNKVWVADFDGYCSVDQYVFRVRGEADQRYVAAFLRSPSFLERAPVDETPGQLPRIRLNEVLDVELVLPNITEQRRIADDLEARLASIDVMTQALNEQGEAIQSLRIALQRDAFAATDPGSTDQDALE